MITNFTSLLKKLQKTDRKQALLYLFCNFVSLLLITAYSAMMFSPTVLLILPEGGDSRKQMIAIFVLALFGCIIFTIYASRLFFRKKARQLGILMALGASRKKLAPGLFKEVITLSGTSSLLGIFAGFPFVWLLWNGFRLFIVNSAEMQLQFDLHCLLLSAVFWLLVVGFSCVTAHQYLKRTNIIDVVQEEHKNEPVKELGKWCGPVGFLLLFAGAIVGYCVPNIYSNLVTGKYPPAWLKIFYLPIFIGLYMIILHTVVHGWCSHKKNPYKNIISRSMMKFQGHQTVNTLIVSTVLIAGASYAMFYIPMAAVSQYISITNRPFDYCYNYPVTQKDKLPNESSISGMAAEYDLGIKDWHEISYAVLAMDGVAEIEDSSDTYHQEYTPLLCEGRFFSESDYRKLTGDDLTVESGTYYAINTQEETTTHWLTTEATLLTNMTTRQTLPITFAGFAHYDFLAGKTAYYVLSDEDYAQICKDLSDTWKEEMVSFDIEGNDSYAFANKLYHTLIDSYDLQYATANYYDRVRKTACEEAGEHYCGDDPEAQITFDQPDSSEFRECWLYMPKMTLLDKTDFLRTYAVFLMMFLFISIICILAVLVISYTRCMTISLNNRYVFDDLRKLGASPTFLYNEIRNQASKVFVIPSSIGMCMMYFLNILIMFGNDGKISSDEIGGLGACLIVLFLFAIVFYLVYRYTVHQMCRQLTIQH